MLMIMTDEYTARTLYFHSHVQIPTYKHVYAIHCVIVFTEPYDGDKDKRHVPK